MIGSSEIRKIIQSNERERKYVEEMPLGGVILPLVKMRNMDVCIWGCTDDIANLISYLNYNGVHLSHIFDQAIEKQGKKYDGIQVLSPDEIKKEIKRPDKVFFIINILNPSISMMNITNILNNVGISNYYTIQEHEKININGFSSTWTDVGRIEYYKNHEKELTQTFEMLSDEESKITMCEYIRAYIECGVYSRRQIDGRYKYFYGDLREGYLEELYLKKENEIWINCGANVGDSIFLYLSQGLIAKKIFAFEGDIKNYRKLCENLALLPDNFRQLIIPINKYIKEDYSFTEHIKNEHITLINADIEGNEQCLIENLKDTIVQYKPVLAMSAYHRADDLVIMPRKIREMSNEYIFKLRKYEASARNISRTAELVLYAIPRCRIVKEK